MTKRPETSTSCHSPRQSPLRPIQRPRERRGPRSSAALELPIGADPLVLGILPGVDDQVGDIGIPNDAPGPGSVHHGDAEGALAGLDERVEPVAIPLAPAVELKISWLLRELVDDGLAVWNRGRELARRLEQAAVLALVPWYIERVVHGPEVAALAGRNVGVVGDGCGVPHPNRDDATVGDLDLIFGEALLCEGRGVGWASSHNGCKRSQKG